MDKAKRHEAICNMLNTVYKAKNADYSDSFGESYAEFGKVAPVVRMDDKMRRIKQLIKTDAQVKDEKLEDSVLDLANYAIMFLLELQGENKEELI